MGIKKIVYLVVVVVSFFIINSLVHSIYFLWQKQSLVTEARQALEEEKVKNRKFTDMLVQAGKQGFVEEEARDKLFLAKPGEKIIVMPSVYIQASPRAAVSSLDTKSNWKKWWEAFNF